MQFGEIEDGTDEPRSLSSGRLARGGARQARNVVAVLVAKSHLDLQLLDAACQVVLRGGLRRRHVVGMQDRHEPRVRLLDLVRFITEDRQPALRRIGNARCEVDFP
jgi:hypothetical protein